MSEVGSQHGVKLDATESPAARRQRMACTLRVMHDEGRGRGEQLAERFLLRGAQFDGVDHERLVVGGEDKADHVASRRPCIPLDKHAER